MKVILILLSFVVLLLSTVPCAAFGKGSSFDTHKNCQENSKDCGDDCDGKCSPFYSCGSCLGFTIQIHFSSPEFKLAIIAYDAPKTTTYKAFAYSSFICKIWQPPKINKLV